MKKIIMTTIIRHYDSPVLPVALLNLLLLKQALGIILFKPLSEVTNITISIPSHNFWPLIPVPPVSSISSNFNPPFSFSTTPPLIGGGTGNPSHKTRGQGRSQDRGSKHPQKVPWPNSLPSHNFWPLIPVDFAWDIKKNGTDNYFQVPDHNFWPFIPVKVDVKPIRPPTVPKLPWPPSPNKYNYGEVMYKSILFFEAQRSGYLPENRKIRWRGHSAVDDQGEFGEDLSGGWYDSGDYIKFGFPMAGATTLLLWGLIEYPDAYRSAGILGSMRDCVHWPLDYFIKAHVDKFVFYGQVGDAYIDHAYWGRPEDMDMPRPAYKLSPEYPGSDLVAETAASMAAGYLAFKAIDPPYAQILLNHAKELFEFAENFRGFYSDSIENAAEFYGSSSDEDELGWAAAWLYRATKNRFYLKRAQYWYEKSPSCWAQSWEDKSCGLTVLLYMLTKDKKYQNDVETMFYEWLPGGTIDYTPKGLAFRSEWGTLRYTANMAFLSLVAADQGIQPKLYRTWAQRQIHYMLGDAGRSYVVGFGENPPTRPHHAASSCRPPPYECTWSDYTKTGPNAHTLFGALVGGPDRDDDYVDDRGDYIHNEVGCDYNGGFQSAVAALRHIEIQMP